MFFQRGLRPGRTNIQEMLCVYRNASGTLDVGRQICNEYAIWYKYVSASDIKELSFDGYSGSIFGKKNSCTI